MAYKLLSVETYLAFNLKFLILTGLWNPYEDYRQWLYYIYYLLVSVFGMAVSAYALMIRAWTLHEDFLRCTLYAFLAIAFICSWVKNVNIMYRRSDVKLIMRILTWEQTLPCPEDVAQYRTNVISTIQKVSKVFTLAWLIDAIGYYVGFYVECLYENRRTLDDLIVGYTWLRPFIQGTNFWTWLGIDYVMYVASISNLVASDCMVMCLMFHISAQLGILNLRLRRCCRNSLDCFDSQISTNEKSTTVALTPNVELIHCIQHYQQIVRLVHVMQSVYGVTLFPQLVSSVIMIAFAALHLFVMKSSNISNAIPTGQAVLALTGIMCQLICYCWGGTTIIAESDLINSAVYESNWYIADKEFKTNMMIFTALAQNPLSLSAFGLFELSLPTLKNVLVKSYSAMAVMKKTNE